jgi:hypothetical protein
MGAQAELEARQSMKLAIDHMEWMANTVHQAHHHQDARKAWRECDIGVCLSTINIIADLRKVWEIKVGE